MHEKTFNSFYNYLKEYNSEGHRLLNFWIDINLFKYKRTKNNLFFGPTDIYEKYLREGSEMYIDFPDSIVSNVASSYMNISKDEYTTVFDELSVFVFDKLKNPHFQNFLISKEFKELEKELEIDEVLFSRLVQARMISVQVN